METLLRNTHHLGHHLSWSTGLVAAGALAATTYGLHKISSQKKISKEKLEEKEEQEEQEEQEEPMRESYVAQHSDDESEILHDLRTEKFESPRKTTGGLEGRFLKMLVKITNAKDVLEIGCFAGYSALCVAEALPKDRRETFLFLVTLDENSTKIAKKYFERAGAKNIELRLGRVSESLKQMEDAGETFDVVFLDADKENYINYYNSLLPLVRQGGLIVVDDTLINRMVESWASKLLEPTQADYEFNNYVAQDDRVEKVTLTVRDGITLIRKK